MAKFLFTMMLANDLGLPTRLVPIARALADRGHEVAVFNPAAAPAKLIAEAGLQNLPMPSTAYAGSRNRFGSSRVRLGCGGVFCRSVF